MQPYDVSVESATYPYKRMENHLWMNTLNNIPKMICDYLMDMPQLGYEPPTDNSYPRVRLMKYIYYDGPRSLMQPAVTPEQKMSIFYDPDHKDKSPTSKGYRIFPQNYVEEAQTIAQTTMRIYIGRIIPDSVYTSQIAVNFDVTTNMGTETNERTQDMSRLTAIEQSLWESLAGVNMTGIGVYYMDRRQHPDTGSYFFTDDRANVGRRIVFGLSMSNSEPPPHP